MNKILFTLIFSSILANATAQSFNTGKLLDRGSYSLGANPLFTGSNNAFSMYLHGGAGLSEKVDFAVRYGIFEGDDYFGADFEWGLYYTPAIQLSLVTGAHVQRDMGLDAGLCLSFSLTPEIYLFSGMDMDIEFDAETEFFTWIPIGLEIYLRRQLSLIMEADLAISEFAPNLFGGGVAVYF